jgi:hypothetical protein
MPPRKLPRQLIGFWRFSPPITTSRLIVIAQRLREEDSHYSQLYVRQSGADLILGFNYDVPFGRNTPAFLRSFVQKAPTTIQKLHGPTITGWDVAVSDYNLPRCTITKRSTRQYH